MQENSLHTKFIYSALMTTCKIIVVHEVTVLAISVIQIKVVTTISVAVVVECKKIV